MILTKRVYDRFFVTDGRRVLVERLWPRGIRKNTQNIDVWLKDVAPSTELRKWFMHDPKKWVKFKKRYIRELKTNKAVDRLMDIALSTDPVTLVYSARDESRNSAVVLQRFIEAKLRAELKRIL